MVQDNVLYAFVGKSFETTLPNAEGEIAIETEGGVYNSADLAGLTFRFVRYNKDGQLEFSPWYRDTAAIASSWSEYSAPVQPIKTLTIDDAGVEKDEMKSIWLVIKDTFTTYGNKSMMKSCAFKTTIAAQPKTDIALGLVANGKLNFAREPEEILSALVVSSEAGDALGAAADTVVGAVGTPTVTIVDTGGDSSTTAVAVGDYFRPGTAVGVGLYRVIASTVGTDGGILTLERPLEDAVNLVGNTSEVVTAADAAAATTSIVFTGTARTNFQAGIWKYMVYDFDVLGDELGTVTDTAGAFLGINTESQIKETEWFAQGNRGYGYRVDVIPVASQLSNQAVYTTLTNANGQCATYTKFRDVGFVNIVGQTPGSLSEIICYLPEAESFLLNIVLNTAASISGLDES